MITGKNNIGFRPSAVGKKTFKTFNPVLNLENETRFFEASTEEIGEAVAMAARAFDTYGTMAGEKKAAFLRAIADEILALGETLIGCFCMETGLPEGRAAGERARTVDQLKRFAALLEEGSWIGAVIDTGRPDREPSPRPDLRKMNFPIGPVAVFGASNFPLAFSTAGGDTASALAAGCPVILKGHPMHAGTSELVSSAILRAAKSTGMPDGVFSHLHSADKEVGVQLVTHPGIKGAGFTGSHTAGRALYELAAKREEPIPVFAEMGSVNPVVLLPLALLHKGEAWARAYAASITLGSGQFCTNPGLLLGIRGREFDEFVGHLAEALREIGASSMLHPGIYNTYEANKQRALTQDHTELSGQYDGETRENFGRPALARVSGGDFIKNPTLHQEVFGPFSLVITCENEAELRAVVSGLEGQLTGTIIAENGELSGYQELISLMQAKVGRLIYNGVPTGVEVCAAMQHGGPYPASTDSRFTSVGTDAIRRWVRPVCFQDWPDALLPDALKNANPLGIIRLVDGELSTSKTG